jgi:hypothetical protein
MGLRPQIDGEKLSIHPSRLFKLGIAKKLIL